MPTLASDVKQ